ncbi:lmo0937 family membrane protein [Paenibacillus senegalimassiliensis]|nr:lmo0937 family membrane protein [Paenibacillus senegalimassiliensis]
MLWTLFGILIAIWLLGFILDVMGGFIHIVLVIAAIVMVINFIRGRGRA